MSAAKLLQYSGAALLDTVDCLARLVVNETITTIEVFLILTRKRPSCPTFHPNQSITLLQSNLLTYNRSPTFTRKFMPIILFRAKFYPFLYGNTGSFGPLSGVGNQNLMLAIQKSIYLPNLPTLFLPYASLHYTYNHPTTQSTKAPMVIGC